MSGQKINTVNCIYNKDHSLCFNTNIKKSLCGIGARVCIEHSNKKCKLKIKRPVPDIPHITPMPRPKCKPLNKLNTTERNNMFTIDFKFSMYDKVTTPHGEQGIITTLSCDGITIIYWVDLKSKSDSRWYDEGLLKAV